jgi:2-keto-4-pentenoate hydratase/2-oxohepta-3-ene-1,7-dioic acid hydratase in catechol pathway
MSDSSLTRLLETARNIHCVGRNYAAHAAELQNEIPKEPVLFSKSTAGLTCESVLNFPAHLQPIHHELELVLRIKHDLPLYAKPSLKDVSHIGLGIDFTARGLQNKLKAKGLPWHLSKSFQNSAYIAGLGPVVEGAIKFELKRGEELLQSGESSLMLFNKDHILAYLCRFIPLQAGDLIYTGTPSGVGSVANGETYQLASEVLGITKTFQVQFI